MVSEAKGDGCNKNCKKRGLFHEFYALEKIKHQIGKVISVNGESGDTVPEQKMVVRGKDVIKNVPLTVPISSAAFYEGFAALLNDLIKELKQAFAPLPSEVVASSLENGIFLTGGGSVLSGVASYVGQHLEAQTITSPSPQEDIIRGILKVS